MYIIESDNRSISKTGY